jgi:hypothetical protein
MDQIEGPKTPLFWGPISWGYRRKNRVKNVLFRNFSYSKTSPSPMVCDFCQKFHWAFCGAEKRLFPVFHFLYRLRDLDLKKGVFRSLFRALFAPYK